MSAFTDGIAVGLTAATTLGVLAARARQAWRRRRALRDSPCGDWHVVDLADQLPPARYVPLRGPDQSLERFQVVRDAESVLRERLPVLGPLYVHEDL
jgi:hypothetical protein